MTTINMGEQGFVWFVGIVVDVLDPKKVGRVKIRILNEHFNDIKDEDLAWAIAMVPTGSASKNGIGISPTGIEADSYVFGFYMDGFEKNHPVVIGTFHLPQRGGDEKKNDVNKQARGEGAVQKKYLAYEPRSPYKARYPFNKVLSTNSGHVIEVDDTPNAERIHIFHKSGAYIEITPKGDINTKAANKAVDITINDKHIIVDKGDLLIQAVKGETIIRSKKKISIKSDEEIVLTGKEVFINAKQNIELVANSKIFVVAEKKIELEAPDVAIMKGKLSSPKTLTIEAPFVKILEGKLSSDKVITLSAPVVKAVGESTLRLDVPSDALANNIGNNDISFSLVL